MGQKISFCEKVIFFFFYCALRVWFCAPQRLFPVDTHDALCYKM